MKKTSLIILVVLVALLVGSVGPEVTAQERTSVTPQDYGQWETLSSGVLSPDGAHLAVSIRRVDSTSELRIFATSMTSPESEPTSDPKVVESGSAPQFASNARWLATGLATQRVSRNACGKRTDRFVTAWGY